ncbi:hypothetical protein RIF29_13845 [Crotalaria pallida]|uniref:Uncharacterized protein n=1 Tax=Crotalaria pallida TaxID=3830 RepID=A0AAN9FFN4_CROPI
MGGRNTVLLDAVSCRIPLVVASQDWPEVTKYTGLVCAQAHRQELIQDLYKTWHDPVRGTVSGGMIRITLRDYMEGDNEIIMLTRWRHCSQLLLLGTTRRTLIEENPEEDLEEDSEDDPEEDP